MINLLQIAVIEESNLQKLIDQKWCKGVDDCDFVLAQEFDYAETMLVDEDNKLVLYRDDNIHSSPQTFIDGFTKALDHMCVKYTITKTVMTYPMTAIYRS